MKSLMVIGLPSGGTDWFAGTVMCEAVPGLKYRREFFNPLLNWEHQRQLFKLMPGEMYQQMTHFGETWREAQWDELFDTTWEKDGRYNFTKDLWLGWNLALVQKQFDIVAMIPRDLRTCFPPSRIRVKQWYDMMFQGLVWNDKIVVPGDWLRPRSETAEQRAVMAWVRYQRQCVVSCWELGIPIVYYEEVLSLSYDDLQDVFGRYQRAVPYLSRSDLARSVCNSRKVIPRQHQFEEQWAEAKVTAMAYKHLMEEILDA